MVHEVHVKQNPSVYDVMICHDTNRPSRAIDMKKTACLRRGMHGIRRLSFFSVGLGPRGVDEAQSALPKNRLHHLRSLMYICRKEELSVRGVFALQPQVRKEVVHSKMAGVVLKHRNMWQAMHTSVQFNRNLNPSTAYHSQSNGLIFGTKLPREERKHMIVIISLVTSCIYINKV